MGSVFLEAGEDGTALHGSKQDHEFVEVCSVVCGHGTDMLTDPQQIKPQILSFQCHI